MNTTEWFHSTTQPMWLEVVTAADAWVHVGSRKAAQERASRVTRTGLKVLEKHLLWGVSLDEDAQVYPSLVEDLDENWESLETGDWDVFLYRNLHENAGELSMFVRARMLTNSVELSPILPS